MLFCKTSIIVEKKSDWGINKKSVIRYGYRRGQGNADERGLKHKTQRGVGGHNVRA